ncbi:hypothetical protein RSAG8_00457, partial [Rhizoctonia solani AG-8 WAC10335]
MMVINGQRALPLVCGTVSLNWQVEELAQRVQHWPKYQLERADIGVCSSCRVSRD